MKYSSDADIVSSPRTVNADGRRLLPLRPCGDWPRSRRSAAVLRMTREGVCAVITIRLDQRELQREP
jgi:hypothetical protein